jgi:hypothetical protein
MGDGGVSLHACLYRASCVCVMVHGAFFQPRWALWHVALCIVQNKKPNNKLSAPKSEKPKVAGLFRSQYLSRRQLQRASASQWIL